jgi:hypothetical protein
MMTALVKSPVKETTMTATALLTNQVKEWGMSGDSISDRSSERDNDDWRQH